MVDAFTKSGVLNLDKINIAVFAAKPGSAMSVTTANLNADKHVRIAHSRYRSARTT